MKKRNSSIKQSGEMLYDEAEQESYKRYKYAYYSQLILSGVLAFVCGLLTCHVFEF